MSAITYSSLAKPSTFPYTRLIQVTIFAIAMALLESAVVIYLRTLMYPEGFQFPLETLNKGLAIVEISREVATIVMLILIGRISGQNANSRFAYFILAFAVWDIFYYVFLKVFLNWPESLGTWDVLFLIPVMWVGPVWSPILLSFGMIIFAILLLHINRRGNVPIGKDWIFLISGAVVCIYSFCLDVIRFINESATMKWSDIGALFEAGYVPRSFPIGYFLAGCTLITFGILRYFWRNRYTNQRLAESQWI